MNPLTVIRKTFNEQPNLRNKSDKLYVLHAQMLYL